MVVSQTVSMRAARSDMAEFFKPASQPSQPSQRNFSSHSTHSPPSPFTITTRKSVHAADALRLIRVVLWTTAHIPFVRQLGQFGERQRPSRRLTGLASALSRDPSVRDYIDRNWAREAILQDARCYALQRSLPCPAMRRVLLYELRRLAIEQQLRRLLGALL